MFNQPFDMSNPTSQHFLPDPSTNFPTPQPLFDRDQQQQQQQQQQHHHHHHHHHHHNQHQHYPQQQQQQHVFVHHDDTTSPTHPTSIPIQTTTSRKLPKRTSSSQSTTPSHPLSMPTTQFSRSSKSSRLYPDSLQVSHQPAAVQSSHHLPSAVVSVPTSIQPSVHPTSNPLQLQPQTHHSQPNNLRPSQPIAHNAFVPTSLEAVHQSHQQPQPQQQPPHFTFEPRRPQIPPQQQVMLSTFTEGYIQHPADDRPRQMQPPPDTLTVSQSQPHITASSSPQPIQHHQRPQFTHGFENPVNPLMAHNLNYAMKEEPLDKSLSAIPGQSPEQALNGAALDPNHLARANLVNSRATTRTGPGGRSIPPNATFVHGTVEKRVACESCGLLFGDLGSLKRHAARAHRAATGKGPVSCSQCNASLKNDQNLRRHVAVCHSGEQENRCDMCSASFSSRGSLRIHQQQVHAAPSASAKSVRGRGRGGAAARGGRMRAEGGVSKGAKSDKSYVCDMCTDTFKWKGNLKRHRELRHLQLRPFICRICNASFGTKSNMRVHLITHNNGAQQQQK